MTTDTLHLSLKSFDTISLQQLNSSAQLLERSETKYIVHTSQLVELITKLQPDFSILTINGKDMFSYENVYLDTPDYLAFQIHQDKAKSRFKIRTRHYKDSDLYFCEFKHKTGKQLSKFRYQCTEVEHGTFTDESQNFCNEIYRSIFGEELPSHIEPSIQNEYKRITLCSKDFSEKITIDLGFKFSDPRSWRTAKLDNIAIIESKATVQPAFTAPLMDSLGIISAESCSKYCLWLILTENVSEYSRFHHTLAHIKSLQTNYKKVSVRKTIKEIEKITQE